EQARALLVAASAGDNRGVGIAPGSVPAGLVGVGYGDDLIRLLTEYELEEGEVQRLIATRTQPWPGAADYLIPESLLRSHGESAGRGTVKAWVPAGRSQRRWWCSLASGGRRR